MPARTTSWPRAANLAPGLVVLLVTGGLLAAHEVPPLQFLWYSACFTWLVVVPGVAVVRALGRRPRVLVEELVVGSVVGLTCLTIAWALCVGIGWGRLLWLYPVVCVGAALASRARRRAVLRLGPHPERMRPGAAWFLALLVCIPLVDLAASVYPHVALPPARGLWYQDLYWHLGLTNEALHSVPPRDPMLGDERLVYHWFANVHMAALSLTSGIDTVTVLARLWIVPIEALATCATFVLGRRLGGRDATGLLAAAMLVVPVLAQPVPWLPLPASNPFLFGSPSQVFALPFMAIGAALLLDVVARPTRWPGWTLLGLVLLGAAGAKTSNLPVLLGGAGVAMLATIRQPAARVRAAVAVVLTGAVLVLSVPVVADTSTGSTLRLGGMFLRAQPWADLRLDDTGHPSRLALVALAVLFTLSLVPALLAVVAGGRDLQDRVSRWFVVGTWVAAVGAFFVLSHPSLSQLYFIRGALPVLAAGAAWALTSLLEKALAGSGRRSWTVVSSVAVVGLVVLLLLRARGGGTVPKPGTGTSPVVGIAVLWLAAVLVATAVVLLLLRVSKPAAAATGAGLLAAVLAGGLLLGGDRLVSRVSAAARQTTTNAAEQLTADEVAGTTWLRTHTSPDTLLATNVHCLGVRTTPGCDARAFWVGALSGHSTYVGAWAYTAGNQNLDTKVGSYRRPFYDPERLRLNDGVFTEPTAEGVDALAAHGVRWLLADRRAGPVDAGLGRLATEVFRSGEVTVYRIDAP